jgi:hypothetical protein
MGGVPCFTVGNNRRTRLLASISRAIGRRDELVSWRGWDGNGGIGRAATALGTHSGPVALRSVRIAQRAFCERLACMPDR